MGTGNEEVHSLSQFTRNLGVTHEVKIKRYVPSYAQIKWKVLYLHTVSRKWSE